jgi:hypothetical protein
MPKLMIGNKCFIIDHRHEAREAADYAKNEAKAGRITIIQRDIALRIIHERYPGAGKTVDH